MALRRLAVLLTASALAVPTAVAIAVPAAAATATLSSAQLASSSKTVTTSTHQALGLNVFASHYSAGNNFTVALAVPHNYESHEWTFKAPSTGVALSRTTRGRISLTSAMSPYGKASLAVNPTGTTTTRSCNHDTRNYTLTRRATVSGVLYFDTRSTGSHAWGHFGSATRSTFAISATLTFNYGNGAGACSYPPTPCTTGVYAAASHGTTNITVEGSGSQGTVSGYRETPLSTPKGALRDDIVFGPAHLTLAVSGAKASFAIADAGSFVAGSATLRGATATASTVPCGANNASSVKETDWYDASYTNGATPLTLQAQVFGSLTLSNLPTGQAFGRTTR